MKTPYRYSVSKEAGIWYGLGGNSVAEFTSPYYFYGFVANWSEITIEDIRNWRMSGFYRERSNSFQLVKGLAKIARHIEYTYGVSGAKNINFEPAKFYIDRLNTETQEYEADYESEFNFTTAQDERDQYTVEMMQGGIEELIKNNEDVEYTIPVTGGNVKTITVSPFRVKGRSIFVTANDENTSGNRPAAANDLYLSPQIMYYSEDFYKILGGVSNKPIQYNEPVTPTYITGQQRNELPTFTTYTNFLFRSTVALTNVRVRMSLPVFFDNKNASSVTFRATLQKIPFNSTGATQIFTTSTITLAGSATVSHTFEIDTTFDLAIDQTVHLVIIKSLQVGNGVEWNWEEAAECIVDYEYYTSQFTVKGLNLYEVGKQLISKATNGAATLQSQLLTEAITYAQGIDCRPDSTLILSGDSIIGITDPTIKISLKDYLKAIDCWFCAGLGIEDDKVVIEKRSYFFQREVSGNENIIAHFSKLANWIIEDAVDIRFNELHIGYKDATNEVGELNGRDEFNTTLKFTSSLTKNKNVLDLVNPISASGTQIYLTYINYVTDESRNKDYKNNNELFALQFKYNPSDFSLGTALYPTDIRTTGTVTGVTDTNRILNIGLSPARCLYRHAYWLLSHFYTSLNSTFGGGAATEYRLTYQTTDRNPDLASSLSNNIYITETADISLDDLVSDLGQSRLFYPKYLTIDVDSPSNYKQAWIDKRNGAITADIEGVTVTGYPLKSTDRGVKPKITQFRLILADNNTLTDLIR